MATARRLPESALEPSPGSAVDGVLLASPRFATGAYLLRAFRPTLHPALADQVEAHHRAVLAEYGVEGLVVRAPLRAQRATWMVVARTRRGAPPCGAVRLELPDPEVPVPLETIVAASLPAQLPAMRAALRGCAEIAGLWIARSHRRSGLAHAVMLAGIDLAARLGLRRLYGLAAEHVIPAFKRTGARVESSFGAAPLPYPSARYQSRFIRWDLPTHPNLVTTRP
jgi:GNAT superfamily N-acetyltransferase